MAINNPILWNAAMTGFTAGVYSQSVDMGDAAASDADIATAAATFAGLIDAGIGTDSTLTASTGQALSKGLLLQGICFAKAQVFGIGESLPDAPPASAMSDLVDGVISAYSAGQAALLPT